MKKKEFKMQITNKIFNIEIKLTTWITTSHSTTT